MCMHEMYDDRSYIIYIIYITRTDIYTYVGAKWGWCVVIGNMEWGDFDCETCILPNSKGMRHRCKYKGEISEIGMQAGGNLVGISTQMPKNMPSPRDTLVQNSSFTCSSTETLGQSVSWKWVWMHPWGILWRRFFRLQPVPFSRGSVESFVVSTQRLIAPIHQFDFAIFSLFEMMLCDMVWCVCVCIYIWVRKPHIIIDTSS